MQHGTFQTAKNKEYLFQASYLLDSMTDLSTNY